MPRVAIVSPKLYPVFNTDIDATFGGAEMALGQVARSLARLDPFDVHALTGDYGQAEFEEIDGVSLHRSMAAAGGTLSNAFRLLGGMRKVAADVYIQRALSPASSVLALFCRLRGHKFVYWVAHDGETDGNHSMYDTVSGRLLLRLLFNLSSRVIVQNEYEMTSLRRQYPDLECVLIKKGIADLHLASEPGRKKYQAIWVGRCEDWKDPESFIALAKACPTDRFTMICPPALGKEPYHRQVSDLAAAVPNLEFRGRMKNGDVLSLVQQSGMFCITSKQEGDWPMVVLEAAASGVPILSLALNYGDLFDRYEGGLSCGGDFDRFVEGFRTLAADEELRTRFGINAHRYVVEEHSVQRQTRRLVETLNDLTA